MTGTIKTVRADKGFGFIRGDGEKEYFFHHTAVQGASCGRGRGPIRPLRLTGTARLNVGYRRR